MSEDDSLLARLKVFEGRSVGPPKRAPDPVNQAMIRHWVEAIGDENPVYTDSGCALDNGFEDVVAPPTMLQAWIMRGFRPPAEEGSAQDELMALLDSGGFTSVVATDCEQEYSRPLVLGDWLTVSSSIEEISPEKQTGLGVGHFVTTRLDFEDQNGKPVATMRFRILKFRPGTGRRSAPAAADAPSADAPSATSSSSTTPRAMRPRPAITRDNAFFFEGTKAGRILVQRCRSCGRLRHPPLPACPYCRSFEWDTVASSGRGTVFSFVVVHHPQVPAFDYPLPIAVVELEEGTRLVGDLIGVAPEDVHIGMNVRAELVAVDDELTLPMFRPADTAEEGDG